MTGSRDSGAADGTDGAPADAPFLLGLLGHPVGHSVSPALHHAALRSAGLVGTYVARDVAPADLDRAVDGLAPLGFRGVNVTVPHKQAVARRCHMLDAEAAAVGAVNTVVVDGDRLRGHNTDTVGFLAGLPEGLPPAGALVIGAGGAARAVVVALVRDGWQVHVAARRPPRAAALESLSEVGSGTVTGHDLHLVHRLVGDARLVVNATPLGLAGERLPAPLHGLAPDQVAYDLVYNPRQTPFLADAAAAGATVIGGLGMLVGQAAAAFELWTGVAADRDAMLRAAQAAL